MDNSDALAVEIKKKLEASGHLSELRAVKLIQDLGCHVGAPYYYEDAQEKKLRELDAMAHVWGAPTDQVECVFPIEVKKSSTPWVVLGHEAVPGYNAMQIDFVNCVNKLDTDDVPVFTWMEWTLQDSKFLFWASNVVEVGKEPRESDRWFAAAINVNKAAIYDLTQNPNCIYSAGHGISAISIYLPTVVLDGPLFGAELRDDGLHVKPINSAIVYFSTSAIEGRRDAFALICTFDALPALIAGAKTFTGKVYQAILNRTPPGNCRKSRKQKRRFRAEMAESAFWLRSQYGKPVLPL